MDSDEVKGHKDQVKGQESKVKSGDVDITALGRGVYLVSAGTSQRVAYAAGPPDARWVFLDGRVHVIDTVRLKADTTDASRAHDEEMALASPMPATVASIAVTPGQEVRHGDLLVMLEAMKMQLPIKAPRDGRIKSVACKPGELVQPGVQLVELE